MKELTEQEYIDELKSEDIDFKSIPKKFRTENVCLAAVIINGLDLKRVKNQTEEICLAAVKSNGWALKYVENQTDEICLAAVNEAGSSLQFVKNQTDEICLAAVKDNGWALEFVKNQTKEIYKEAFNDNALSFIHVDDDVYEYDSKEVLNFYNYISDDMKNFLRDGLKKIAEILNRLDEGDLVKAVSIDLKDVFTEENLKLSEDLANIKSKAYMISVTEINNEINHNKKPKII